MEGGLPVRKQKISVDRCRRIVGGKCDLESSELEEVRDQLYALAEIVLDQIDHLDRNSGHCGLENPQIHQFESKEAN